MMCSRNLVSGIVAWCSFVLACHSASADAILPVDRDFFESQVRPLLLQHCAECHSRKAGDPEGGLSFDSRADFLAAAGIAVAGRPDDSLLVTAVRYDGGIQMPPDGRLSDTAIGTIEEWVRRGLPWPDDGSAALQVEAFDLEKRKAAHWCWQPPRSVPAPAVRNADWCHTLVDPFVLHRLESAGLAPAPEAPPAVLVRRAAELLTGLPPDPADVEQVVADPDPHAFESYVDRLLASPHYGERFARHWLDIVRYGETRSHDINHTLPNARQYRDWAVRAFNEDLSYDQFVLEQIAGDLLPQPRIDPATGVNESVVGTGFWYLGEEMQSPTDLPQDEGDRTDNRIDTFGKAFLGLPLGCARCHDHKFDAISHEDYYALAGMLLSSSYRQVPFETLFANQEVASRLDAADTEAQSAIVPLIDEALKAAGLTPAALASAAAPRSVAADQETILADYTRGVDSTPVISDAWAWGIAAVPAGRPVLLPSEPEMPRRVGVEPIGHVRSDAVWSKTHSNGEREASTLGSVDRAGRVLRTPKARVTEGVIWHRVRGKLQIFAVVDSHVMIHGPLHGPNIMTVDTQGEWRWIQQDLRRDIPWDRDHIVHVEYATLDGEAAVAETVAAVDEPVRLDPPGPAAVNAALVSPVFDWASPAALRLLSEAERRAVEHAGIAAQARLESATAPAILDGNGIDQYVLFKGTAARRGDIVPRRFLEAIDGGKQPAWPTHSSGRLELAERVIDPSNPLTGRVIVNRIWHHLFGRGLVPSPDNFGLLGEQPADPLAQSLLDTLAVRFREEGGSIKQLVRMIVTSAAWRMASSRDPAAVEQDPLNLLLHHSPVRRLEGEAIRDKILAISGRLDRTVGGPSVDVFLTEVHDGIRESRPRQSGPLDGAGRRSIYTRIDRNFLPSFLVAFDLPPTTQAMGRRSVTNVPAQALTLMNDPFVVEQAHLWAEKILADTEASADARITRMYLEAFARRPSAEELAKAGLFLESQAARYSTSLPESPRHPATWADFAHALINAKEFIFVP